MSIQAEFYEGNYGHIIRLVIRDQDGDVVDVSGASTKQVHLVKPDNTVLKKDATFTTDGKDGKIEYVTQSGDIDSGDAGHWMAHGLVEIPTGKWHTTQFGFEVFVPLESA